MSGEDPSTVTSPGVARAATYPVADGHQSRINVGVTDDRGPAIGRINGDLWLRDLHLHVCLFYLSVYLSVCFPVVADAPGRRAVPPAVGAERLDRGAEADRRRLAVLRLLAQLPARTGRRGVVLAQLHTVIGQLRQTEPSVVRFRKLYGETNQCRINRHCY